MHISMGEWVVYKRSTGSHNTSCILDHNGGGRFVMQKKNYDILFCWYRLKNRTTTSAWLSDEGYRMWKRPYKNNTIHRGNGIEVNKNAFLWFIYVLYLFITKHLRCPLDNITRRPPSKSLETFLIKINWVINNKFIVKKLICIINSDIVEIVIKLCDGKKIHFNVTNLSV